MKKDYRFGRNPLLVLCFLCLLSPALRLFPAAAAQAAGRGAWLSALASFPPLLLYLLFLCAFMKYRKDGEGLDGLLLRAGGPIVGRLFLTITSLWLLLYAAFLLRAGANRFITTIYPNTPSIYFSLSMGLLGLLAALGSARSLVRFAKLVAPVVLGVLLFVLIAALFSIDTANLSPLTVYDIPKIALGALPAVDVVAAALYSVCYMEGQCEKKPGRFSSFSTCSALMVLLLFLLSVTIIGKFGAELCARLTRPFFSLVRNLVFLSHVERIEALVVSLWVFPDFLLFSLILSSASRCLRLIFGFSPDYNGEKLTDISDGRFLIWICAGAVMLLGALMTPEPEPLLFWSLTLIPILNMSYAFGFLPLTYVFGRLNKNI